LLAQHAAGAFEIIIADDGSREETAQCIKRLQQTTSIPIKHIWQPDEGFRAAAIRNKAILAATGDYIVFLDGDCIPRKNFIAEHRALAQANTFLAGNRILLTQAFTAQVLGQSLLIHKWTFREWLIPRLSGDCNRILPLLSLPRCSTLRLCRPKRWKGAKGCNLGVWKADLINVNGWEEEFTGWGYEDSDLVMRLLRAGVKRKAGHYRVPVIHLWHAENDRARERENWALLEARQEAGQTRAAKGLHEYTI
jgi:glycosyltransferase involved in cell wall biosynthesis